jgi:hypothetical protein
MNSRVVALLSLLAVFSGCAKKAGSATAGVSTDPGTFFNVVYQSVTTRGETNSSWVNTLGIYQVQFKQLTSSAPGTFTFFYSSYTEPQFCPYGTLCVCSGGVSGTFTVLSLDNNTTPATGPYDPMTPYLSQTDSTLNVDPLGGTDPTTGESYAKIYAYVFQLTITTRNLSAGCKPEVDRPVRLVRYSDGKLVMINDFRELYMIPVTKD